MKPNLQTPDELIADMADVLQGAPLATAIAAVIGLLAVTIHAYARRTEGLTHEAMLATTETVLRNAVAGLSEGQYEGYRQ